MLFEIIQITLCFSLIDRVLTYRKVQGVYYLLHALHNAWIVALTGGDVIRCISQATNGEANWVANGEANWVAIQLCCALHLYHTLVYWKTFRFDDWLHHGLMFGVALPVSLGLGTQSLVGPTFFFTTGLPGGIDYALLALVKNGYMDRLLEKRINTFLNVWIRSPGCILVALLGMASQPFGLGTLAPLITFWNGQYFMEQVVENYARLKIEDLPAAEPKA